MQEFISLLYHEVRKDGLSALAIEVADGYCDRLPPLLYISVLDFEEQLRWLRDEGYQSLSMKAILDFLKEGKPLPERAVHLTFDDMFQSVYELVYPLLVKYGFQASGFVAGDWIFDKAIEYKPNVSRSLSWPELDAMGDHFEYAHHSSALHRRNGDGSLFVQSSAEILIEDLGRYHDRLSCPKIFAHPFGIYDDHSLAVLKDAGIQAAFSTKPGANSRTTPPLELRRNIVAPATGTGEFESMLKKIIRGEL